MHPLIVVAVAAPLVAVVHQIWKDEREFNREIRGRIFDLIYDTTHWYHTIHGTERETYSTVEEMTPKIHGTQDKQWDTKFENMKTKLEEFDKYICRDKLKRKDQHFYINNIYYTCWTLVFGKYENKSLTVEQFIKRFKKEIDYLKKTEKNFGGE